MKPEGVGAGRIHANRWQRTISRPLHGHFLGAAVVTGSGCEYPVHLRGRAHCAGNPQIDERVLGVDHDLVYTGVHSNIASAIDQFAGIGHRHRLRLA